MSQTDECKGCREKVRLSKEEIQQIFGDAAKVRDVKLVPEDVYEMRFKICSQCPALHYSTTCIYCGCLMPVKAKLQNAKCPYPYAPKW